MLVFMCHVHVFVCYWSIKYGTPKLDPYILTRKREAPSLFAFLVEFTSTLLIKVFHLPSVV